MEARENKSDFTLILLYDEPDNRRLVMRPKNFREYLTSLETMNIYVDYNAHGTGHTKSTFNHAVRMRQLGFTGIFNFILRGIGRNILENENLSSTCGDYGDDVERNSEDCEGEAVETLTQYEDALENFVEQIRDHGNIGLYGIYAEDESTIPSADFGFTGGLDDAPGTKILERLKVNYFMMLGPHLWGDTYNGILSKSEVKPFSNEIQEAICCDVNQEMVDSNSVTARRMMAPSLRKLLTSGNPIIIAYNLVHTITDDSAPFIVSLLQNITALPDVNQKIIILDCQSKGLPSIADIFKEAKINNIANIDKVSATVVKNLKEFRAAEMGEEKIIIVKLGYSRHDIFNELIRSAALVICEGQGTAVRSIVLGTPLIHIPVDINTSVYKTCERRLLAAGKHVVPQIKQLTESYKKLANKFTDSQGITAEDIDFFSQLLNRESIEAAYFHSLADDFSLENDQFSQATAFFVREVLNKGKLNVADTANSSSTVTRLAALGDDRHLATHGHDRTYLYSISDVNLLLTAVRRNRLNYQLPGDTKQGEYKVKGGDQFGAYRENQAGIFIADPYVHAGDGVIFQNFLRDDINIITGRHEIPLRRHPWQTMPHHLFFPFLHQGHWQLIGLEINYTRAEYRILWDDPFGVKHFPQALYNELLPSLHEAVRTLVATQRSLTVEEIKVTGVRHIKELDQQGLGRNGHDCGPILLQNLDDYIAHAATHRTLTNFKETQYRVLETKTPGWENTLKEIRQRDGEYASKAGLPPPVRIQTQKALRVVHQQQKKVLGQIPDISTGLIQAIHALPDDQLDMLWALLDNQRSNVKSSDGLYTKVELENAYRLLCDIIGSESTPLAPRPRRLSYLFSPMPSAEPATPAAGSAISAPCGR